MGVEPTIAAERRRSTVLKTAMVTGPHALPCCDSKGSGGIAVVIAPGNLASAVSEHVRVQENFRAPNRGLRKSRKELTGFCPRASREMAYWLLELRSATLPMEREFQP